MKKIYFIFTIFLVLTSCSEWKYSKGVKGKHPERYVLAKAAEPSEETWKTAEREEAPAKEDAPVPAKEVSSEAKKSEKPVANEVTTSTSPVDQEEVTILKHEEDTLAPVDEEALDIALEAEKRGRVSRTLGIVGLALTVTYLFALAGLVLAIIALVKGVKSLKARYNTPEGVRMARAGVIMSSIVIGLYVISLLILIAIIVAFLL